jgi:hypothetical protein
MPTFAWAILLKPFFLLLLSVTVLIPSRMAVRRWMKDGELKRLLLRRIS